MFKRSLNGTSKLKVSSGCVVQNGQSLIQTHTKLQQGVEKGFLKGSPRRKTYPSGGAEEEMLKVKTLVQIRLESN